MDAEIQGEETPALIRISRVGSDPVEIGQDDLVGARHLKYAIDLHQHAKDVTIVCLCRGEGPSLLHLVNRSNVLALRRNPNSAMQHAPDCRFHSRQNNAVQRSGVAPLDRDQDDRLSATRRRKSVASKVAKKDLGLPPIEGRRRRSGRARRRAPRTTQVGQLETLIDVSEVNVYDPNSSCDDWDVIAGKMRVFMEERPTAEPLFNFVASRQSSPDLDAIRAALRTDSDLVQVVGSIQECVAVGAGQYELRLEGMPLPVLASSSVWASAIRRTRSKLVRKALAELCAANRKCRVLCLITAGLSQDGRICATKIALCITTLEGIPVESGLELHMALVLIAEGRRFRKPLFRQQGERYLHDFVVLDMGREFPIEVNGMKKESHCAHYAEVQAYLEEYFENHHAIWWANDPNAPFPVLPPVGRFSEESV